MKCKMLNFEVQTPELNFQAESSDISDNSEYASNFKVEFLG